MTVCTVTSRTSSRYKITYIVTPFLSTIPHQQVMSLFFFFNDPATPEIYPLPLPDALPIYRRSPRHPPGAGDGDDPHRVAWPRPPGVHRLPRGDGQGAPPLRHQRARPPARMRPRRLRRSEEHTSELQSRSDLVCRLLLEKKK